jgi:flagellar protein FlaJ
MNSIAENEGRAVEKILPDALQLIASNIKAGLTTEKALIISAQPEFGSLSVELKETSQRILSGERMDKALMLIPKRIKGDVLDRTMWLMGQGIRSGGQIANLLMQMSDDLREENALKQEIGANISMYVMLILFSAAFGAPVLFGISSYIVGVLSSQSANINIPSEMMQQYVSTSPALGLVGVSSSGVSEDFVVFFTEIALFLTCVFAALVLGVISHGHEADGIKYIPILLVISFVLFFLTRTLAKTFLGGMMF